MFEDSGKERDYDLFDENYRFVNLLSGIVSVELLRTKEILSDFIEKSTRQPQ